MAEAFESPDVVEMKGTLTGVTRLSRKVKLAIVLGIFAIAMFIVVSILSMDDGAPQPKSDTEAQDTQKQEKRAAEPAKPDFSGVGDGQAALSPSGPNDVRLEPTFAVGVASVAAASAPEAKGNGLLIGGASQATVPAAQGVKLDQQQPMGGGESKYQTSEETAAARAKAALEESRKKAVEGGIEMEGGGDLGRLAAAGTAPGLAGGAVNSQLAALAAAAQAVQGSAQGPAASPIVPTAYGGQQQDDPNKQPRKEQFLRTAENASKAYLNERVQAAVSPFEIKAGWVIPAALECGVNSDLPGQTCARVTENVFDSATGRHLLIPQATKLIGTYDSQIAYGQKRILAVWNRMIFPDGSSISLNGMPGADKGGYAGFDADVDNHYGKVFSGALLLAAFSAGISLTQKQSVNVNGTLTPSQVVTQEVGRQLGQTGNAFIQKGMNIQPTLSRDPGYKFNVVVTRDIVFPSGYAAKGSR
ncbi:hypothetical protein LMG19282_01486 [Cupriavidus campinensis]|nr:TrbI/VirB10 family protein [Cupriavidus campinensis]CAG2138371.1 hypothetical protein LMG19282_01486 [Cupriavidus campinensis]